jgi:FimV-like protein
LAGKTGSAGPAKPADAETVAAGKLDLIRRLIDDGRTERAREKLQELIQAHPQTRAAEEARKLLDRL